MSQLQRPATPSALAVILALGSFIGPLVVLPLIPVLDGYAFSAGAVIGIALAIAAWRADRSEVLHGGLLWSFALWGGTGLATLVVMLMD